MLPRGLLGRSLLIVLVPLVALQAVAFTYLLWRPSRPRSPAASSAAIAGEIAQTIDLLHRYPGDQRPASCAAPGCSSRCRCAFIPGRPLPPDTPREPARPDGRRPGRRAAGRRSAAPSSWTGRRTRARPRPRPAARRRARARGAAQAALRQHHLYLRHLGGRHGAAAVRHRGAVPAQPGPRHPPPGRRRRKRSAWAATASRSEPEGATEVRQAAAAFNRMQARILRFLAQRTEMLAGVSHDLRTPLTRLRLALAVLPRDARAARRHRRHDRPTSPRWSA